MSLTLQDLLAILGPMGAFGTFMWYHFNNRFEKMDHKFEKMEAKIDNLKGELIGEIKRVEEKLGEEIKRVETKLVGEIKRVEEKIDAVRDRVSRIEGQLVPAKIVSFEETRPREVIDQKSISNRQ